MLTPPSGLYDEFAARFPYVETDDQLHAIDDVFSDFARGRPMDRLICGDVGFGKTEVALRAAFVAAMSGRQVAIVAPTTLLARQHFKTFEERFKGWPVKVRQLSRLVPAKQATATRKELADYAVTQNLTTLRNRVNELGVSEPLVQRQGQNRIEYLIIIFSSYLFRTSLISTCTATFEPFKLIGLGFELATQPTISNMKAIRILYLVIKVSNQEQKNYKIKGTSKKSIIHLKK